MGRRHALVMLLLALVASALACSMIAGLDGYALAPDGAVDAFVPDTAVAEASPDVGIDAADATMLDTADTSVPPDTFVPDTFVPDTFVPDTFVPDTFVPDTFIPDTFVLDTFVLDTFVPDTFVPDTFVPDTFVLDTFVADTNKPDAVGLSCASDAAICGEAVCCTKGPCTGTCVHNCNITGMCMPGDVCCPATNTGCANMCVKHCSTAGCPGGGTCNPSTGLCGG